MNQGEVQVDAHFLSMRYSKYMIKCNEGRYIACKNKVESPKLTHIDWAVPTILVGD